MLMDLSRFLIAVSFTMNRVTARMTRGERRSAPPRPSITACHTSQELATTTSPSADCTTRPSLRSANKIVSREDNFDIPSDSSRERSETKTLLLSRGRQASWLAGAAMSSLPQPTRLAVNLSPHRSRVLPLNTRVRAAGAPVGGNPWTVDGR